jgi:S-adenosylmethionine:tRNA ribosyltransferase-isomerase
MHAEAYDIAPGAAEWINRARAKGHGIWAVGTTVVRALESALNADGLLTSGSNETSLFIRPPYDFKVVNHLITNFHLPRSTLLMLVCAFGGYEPVMNAYREAVKEGYRFYSYGDAMLIL